MQSRQQIIFWLITDAKYTEKVYDYNPNLLFLQKWSTTLETIKILSLSLPAYVMQHYSVFNLILSKVSDDWLGVYTHLFIPYPVKKDKIGLEAKLYVKKSKKKWAITKEFSD